MALQDFYVAVDGAYDDVKGRLLTDERIEKFVGLFFQDPTYQTLVEKIDESDLKEAFRAAHTMKGVSRDLGFTRLAEPATKLADALRPNDAGEPADLDAVPALMEQVTNAYQQLLDARSEFCNEAG